MVLGEGEVGGLANIEAHKESEDAREEEEGKGNAAEDSCDWAGLVGWFRHGWRVSSVG